MPHILSEEEFNKKLQALADENKLVRELLIFKADYRLWPTHLQKDLFKKLKIKRMIISYEMEDDKC